LYFFTGDVAPHRAWNETEASQFSCISKSAEFMRQELAGKTVISAIGNHDNYPTNLFSVKDLDSTKRMLDLYTNEWQESNSFGSDQRATLKSGGYYTMLRPFNGKKNFRIVVTNSNYAYTMNWFNPYNNMKNGEAKTHNSAIENILEKSCMDNSNELVILIIHHSIGDMDFVEAASIYWQNVIVKYSKCIKLIMSGHSHLDEFRLIKDENNVVKSMVYIATSVDSHDFFNPSVRSIYIDKETEEIIDYDQFFMDIANVPASGDPEMKLLYSARREYGLADMSPSSFEDLICRFESEPDLLVKHLNHGTSDAVTVSQVNCTEACRKDHQCRQMHAQYSHYVKCSGKDQVYSFYGLSFGALPHVIIP